MLYRLMAFCLLSILLACGPTLPQPSGAETKSPLAITQLTITETTTPIPDPYEEALHLFDYDMQSPPAITENSVQHENGYSVHDIYYPSPRGGNVTSFLLIPDGSGPFAGMILMHGSSGSRASLLPLAKDLVVTGSVVLTIDGPAARQINRDWIHFTPQDRDEQIQLIIDLRRGVDVLKAHPGVDDARIGYIGYSYGAAMGGLLAGVEPRIKAYGLMVGDGGLVNHFLDGDRPVGGFERVSSVARQAWLDAMRPIEPIHFVSHASPSALFFQNARRDTLVSETDALAYQAAGSEPKRVEWYDSGHGLPTQAFSDMVHWLEEQIGIDATRFKDTTS